MSWHGLMFEEMGWLEGFQTRCKASVSGLCLAVTNNWGDCEPECHGDGKMEGETDDEYVGMA